MTLKEYLKKYSELKKIYNKEVEQISPKTEEQLIYLNVLELMFGDFDSASENLNPFINKYLK